MIDPKKRTWILGGVFAAVVGFGVMKPVVMGPIDEARDKADRAAKSLETAKDKDYQLELARKRLGDAQYVSLPHSLNDAQRLYQEWITDLAIECNFANPSILPGRKDVRSGKYLSVGIDVDAEASLKDLSRFLFLFDQADLLHRISALNIETSGSSKNPRLEFTLTAEALSVDGADEKTEIAARTKLTKELSEDATSLTIPDTAGFPKKTPFLARVGLEIVNVTDAADGVWTVERGFSGSRTQKHNSGTVVQHFPVVYDRRERSFDEYQAFLEQSLFTKPSVPRTYRSKLDGLADQIIEPGDTASVTARVDDYDVDVGEIRFALQDAPEGMTIDPVTGRIQFETTKETEPTEYAVTVLATQENNESLSLSGSFQLRIRLPNAAPTLTLDKSAVVLLGRPFTLQPTATDDGDASQLEFSLKGDAIPDGLAIDPKTGKLTWQPPATMSPGTHNVQVSVADKGDPPKTATKTIELMLRDDDAQYTKLTATVTQDGVTAAWFDNQRTKAHDVLKVGDTLEIADIKAEIVEIEARLVKIQDAEGIWLLGLDNRVRDRVLREPAKKPAEKPAEDSEHENETDEESAEDDTADTDEEPA